MAHKVMRAKLKLHHITPQHDGDGKVVGEMLNFHAVAASRYPEDGSDENNTFARFSPSAVLQLNCHNPDLIGKLPLGTEYYVDFTPAEK